MSESYLKTERDGTASYSETGPADSVKETTGGQESSGNHGGNMSTPVNTLLPWRKDNGVTIHIQPSCSSQTGKWCRSNNPSHL